MSVTIRERGRKGKKRTIYLDIYHNGQRLLENTGLRLTGDRVQDGEKRRMADALRAQREMEQHAGRYGMVPEFKRRVDLTSYIGTYVQQRKAQGSTEQQLNSFRSMLKMLRAYAPRPVEMAAATPRWLEGLKTFLLARVSPNTAVHYYGLVTTAFNRAMKEGIITTNPCQRVDHIKRIETQRSYLTLSEVQRLADTECNYPEIKRAFLFSCFTGLRLSDVEALAWKHVVDGELHIRMKKTGGVLTLPLSDTAKRFLGEAGEPDARVFALPSRSVLRYNLLRWARKAGITKHVTAHTARHSFATLALTSGVDIYTVSKLLGHRNVNTTQIYAKVVDAKKIAAVNLLPKLEAPVPVQITETSVV